jgi:hypothetical protein
VGGERSSTRSLSLISISIRCRRLTATSWRRAERNGELSSCSEDTCAAAVPKEMRMKALLSLSVGRLLALVRNVGPYAAIELLLPGGTIVALLYWWYSHRVRGPAKSVRPCAPGCSAAARLEPVSAT